MAKTVPMIGIDPAELGWIRLLVALLRHPDPVVPELTRHALQHIEQVLATRASVPIDQPLDSGSLDQAG